MTRYYDQIENVTFCGKATLTNIEKNNYLAYKKCIYKGTLFHTLGNVYNKKNDDICIQLKSGQFYRIIDILNCDNVCKLRLSIIKIFSDDPFPGVHHIK